MTDATTARVGGALAGAIVLVALACGWKPAPGAREPAPIAFPAADFSVAPVPAATAGDLPTRAPALTGTLTMITGPSGKSLGTAQIEERPGGGGRKIQAGLTATTRFFDLRVGSHKAVDATTLRQGLRVRLWIPPNSVCAQSYPERCTADTIAILDPP